MARVMMRGFCAILGVCVFLVSHHQVNGLDCLACTNLPFPTDCSKRIQCTSNEQCYVEQVVTQGGVLDYNMGCRATQSCTSTKRRSSASQNFIDFVTTSDVSSDYDAEDEPIVVCSECCNSKNYCNIQGCGTVNNTPKNRQLCAKCDDVLAPRDCEAIQLCQENEVCFTEFITINGDERYRLGCTLPKNCGANSTSSASSVPETALVGKRQDPIVPAFLKYCSKCCDNQASGVCNTELCFTNGVVPSGTVVKELTNPPPRNDFCSDLLSNACPALILDKPALCLDPRYKNFGCRESCGTCVNPDQGGNGNSSHHAVQPTDCFYDSAEYMGAYRHTYTDKTCIQWVDVGRPLGKLPDENITDAENKCRDPNGLRGHPWCYVTQDKWEFCPVPFCQECFYSGKSSQYNGRVNKADSGETCVMWSSLVAGTPGLAGDKFPEKSVAEAENYCRDPFGTGRPQCVVGTSMRNCSIPICHDPCQDRNTDVNCTLVSSIVCSSPYLSVTQCAKTCSKCDYGVLPNVAKEPPSVVCEDNPLASCPLLSSLVCKNETDAISLCPKTCDVCDKLFAISTTASPVTITTQQITTQHIAQTTIHTTHAHTTNTHALTTTTAHKTTTPTTTAITTPHWLEWGPWNCSLSGDQCFQIRYRKCSSGVCGPDNSYYDLKPCNEHDCPVACEDNPSFNCSSVREYICQLGLGPKACPKTCGLCGNCYDLLNCTSQGARSYFCATETSAIQNCRKTCNKCDKYPIPVTLNACLDPIESPGKCYQLHKEVCICKDTSIVSICEGYCGNQCIQRNDTNIDCHVIEQPVRKRALLTKLLN